MKEKLPKEFKEKWVAALRSGDYEQGAGYLYESSSDTYCCIGVCCSIVGMKKWTINQVPLIDSDLKTKTKSRIPSMLHGVCDDGNPEYNPIVEKLAGFNDEGKSFNWIASYIQRYL